MINGRIMAQNRWLGMITLAPFKHQKSKENDDKPSQEVDAFLSISLLE